MKLAEALIERSDLQKAIAEVRNRMKANAKVQEGDEPVEKMEKLFPLHDDLMNRLEWLIIHINKTNSATPFRGVKLADAIAMRDCLKSKIKAYKDLFTEGTSKGHRYARLEIKYVRCVDLAKLRGIIDSLSKRYRELDTEIQKFNWTVDLLETGEI